jgi:hypothetical protein
MFAMGLAPLAGPAGMTVLRKIRHSGRNRPGECCSGKSRRRTEIAMERRLSNFRMTGLSKGLFFRGNGITSDVHSKGGSSWHAKEYVAGQHRSFRPAWNQWQGSVPFSMRVRMLRRRNQSADFDPASAWGFGRFSHCVSASDKGRRRHSRLSVSFRPTAPITKVLVCRFLQFNCHSITGRCTWRSAGGDVF